MEGSWRYNVGSKIHESRFKAFDVWKIESAIHECKIYKKRCTDLLQWGGWVQSWESVCWGVLGIPLLENKIRFKVLGFWFLVCGLVSKIFHVFQKIVVTYCQIAISCFLIAIDLTSMISKIFSRIFIIYRRASFPNMFQVSKCSISKTMRFIKFIRNSKETMGKS